MIPWPLSLLAARVDVFKILMVCLNIELLRVFVCSGYFFDSCIGVRFHVPPIFSCTESQVHALLSPSIYFELLIKRPP